MLGKCKQYLPFLHFIEHIFHTGSLEKIGEFKSKPLSFLPKHSKIKALINMFAYSGTLIFDYLVAPKK